MTDSSDTGSGRIEDSRREIATEERREPLRRRLLIALGDGASTPTRLHERVGASKEAVSRKLGEMREAGLVTVVKDGDDRRRNAYSLTRGGRAALGRHLAFGPPPDPPPAPAPEEIVEFLREALDGAVAMRRRENRLQDALDRIGEIYDQAVAAEAHDLALEALAELVTTQRQDRQRKERAKSLVVLEEIAVGKRWRERGLANAAIAHLHYERGKVSELGPADDVQMAHHLIAAKVLFEQLIESAPKRDSRGWRSRRAWSLVSLAHNFRDQSRFEGSLQHASSALQTFEELDDDYGRTQCWFLFGFCLRQLRRFNAAWDCLRRADEIAIRNSFNRAAANCLVQMGEVRRCRGETSEARELLSEARKAARRLGLGVAGSFATSGLAAIEYQEKDYEKSRETLRTAQNAFGRCKHREGIALNARRYATVARRLSSEGVAPDEAEVKRLIRLSEKHYKALGSPAGVAACEVERGWMRQIAPDCGDLKEVLDKLDRLLKDERGTLEQDAWVPTVLDEFAKQLGSTGLKSAAREVRSQSERHLDEQAEAGIRRISGLAKDFDGPAEPDPSTAVIEMGGESRRKAALLAA